MGLPGKGVSPVALVGCFVVTCGGDGTAGVFFADPVAAGERSNVNRSNGGPLEEH